MLSSYIDSIRNYAILHIVTDEAKVFQTKERAPLMLCFEAFRPEELQFKDHSPTHGGTVFSLKQLKSRKLKLNALGDHKEYENYRSSSWDSAHLASDGAELIDPLILKQEQSKPQHLQNPYVAYQRSQSKKKKAKYAEDDNYIDQVNNYQAKPKFSFRQARVSAFSIECMCRNRSRRSARSRRSPS